MVRDFLTWWVGQLADCVPERWRRLGSVDANALVIAPTGSLAGGIDAVAVSLRRNGRETSLGRFGLTAEGLAGLPRLAEQSAVLRLIDADVMRKTVILPMAAERDLDQVLSLRWTARPPLAPRRSFGAIRSSGATGNGGNCRCGCCWCRAPDCRSCSAISIGLGSNPNV